MELLKIGMISDDVAALQKKLLENGYTLKLTGIFDELTELAIKSFQKDKNLTVDGIVGSKTWSELFQINSLVESDYIKCSNMLGVDVATIKAVCEVESGGSGFLVSGKPRILFEGHVFWNELTKSGLNPEKYILGNEDILHRSWNKSNYLGGEKEYERLEKAIQIDRCCALKSASWGLFQIMGFNYLTCGCDTIDEFVQEMKKSEGSQLCLFAEFIRRNGWGVYLRDLDWSGFARKYNGPGYRENQYDVKLEKAYKKYK